MLVGGSLATRGLITSFAGEEQRILKAIIASLGARRRCIICGKAVRRFMPYRDGWRGAPPLIRALDVVGSDLDNFGCPHCGSHDRERHLLLYMQESGMLEGMEQKAVMHFAPEPHLSRRIAALKPARYVRCDLFPSEPDIARVDMLDIPFEAQSFDLVIANHVLEHVADDAKALSEIRRVLKVAGRAILQTPFSAALTRTWEDPGISTDVARLQAYGQEDHVRLYGRDIFERFAAVGLKPLVRRHEELLGAYDPVELGLNAVEPFFLFVREGA